MSYKVMLSYSWQNSAERVALSKHLDSIDGVTVLFDKKDIAIGSQVHQTISDLLTEADCLVVLLTKQAVSSKEVLDEVTRAHERSKHIVPIVADDVAVDLLPWFLREINFVKYSPSDFDGVVSATELAIRAAMRAPPPRPRDREAEEHGKEMMKGLFDKIFAGSKNFLKKIIDDVVRIQRSDGDGARRLRRLRIYLETELEDVNRILSKDDPDAEKKEPIMRIANALMSRTVRDKRQALQAATRALDLRQGDDKVDDIFDEVKDTVHFFLAEQEDAGDKE